jgi:regulator of protease activity HflC (stomatin/prohibitin superfamily)
MSALSSVTSGSANLRQQSQLQRTADQASQAARALQAQARDAQAVADNAQGQARSLEMQATRAQAVADQASISAQVSASSISNQASQSNVYSVLPKMVSLHSQTSTLTASASRNVGTVINTTA